MAGTAKATAPKQTTGIVVSSPAIAEESPSDRWIWGSTGERAAMAMRRLAVMSTKPITAAITPRERPRRHRDPLLSTLSPPRSARASDAIAAVCQQDAAPGSTWSAGSRAAPGAP